MFYKLGKSMHQFQKIWFSQVFLVVLRRSVTSFRTGAPVYARRTFIRSSLLLHRRLVRWPTTQHSTQSQLMLPPKDAWLNREIPIHRSSPKCLGDCLGDMIQVTTGESSHVANSAAQSGCNHLASDSPLSRDFQAPRAENPRFPLLLLHNPIHTHLYS